MENLFKEKNIRYVNAPVAQWITRRTSNPKIVGSNPTGSVR